MSKYERIEAKLGRRTLDRRLRYWRACGVSCPAIARMLEHDTGVHVSAEGVRRWIIALDAEAAA